MLRIQQTEKGIAFRVRVQPRASREEVMGIQGNVLKVKVSSPPVRGAANQALISLLAGYLCVRKGQIEILSGQKAREKVIGITGPHGELINRLNKVNQTQQ